MIIEKNGYKINTEKVWGIEFGFSEGQFDAPVYCWHLWAKYTSQRRMLQALSDFRKQNPATLKTKKNGDWVQFFNHYRPVHVNYNL